MKRFKLVAIVMLSLASVGIFYYLSSARVEISADNFGLGPISFPISFPDIPVPKGWKLGRDDKQDFQLTYPLGLDYYKQDEYFGSTLQKNVINIVDSKDPNDTRFNIKIIPFSVDNKQTALSALENYIVTYVGITPKNNQKTFKKNGFDIAQIGYNPFFDDGENYFRVYSLIKKGTHAWIFTVGYVTPDMTKTDSLDTNNSKEASLFEQVMNSFTLKDDNVRDTLNKIDTTKVSKDWIKNYHDFNSKFETNI